MTFEETFKNWTLEQKVEWALGPNICNLSENMRSIIVDLQAENKQLKADLEHARSYKHTIKMRNRNLQDENERLKSELQQSVTKCNKLKCLALHAMIGYGKYKVRTCDYDYKHGIMYERWCDFTDKVVEAYRKAKKELKEGK